MTDAALLAKRLAIIETSVHELRTLGRPEAIATDLRERRFIEHTLQIAIQAALDAASHIVSARRLGEARTNRELFELLARDGWITEALAASLRRMVGFRNVLVHGEPNARRDVPASSALRSPSGFPQTRLAFSAWRRLCAGYRRSLTNCV